jgi:hypothetical protein
MIFPLNLSDPTKKNQTRYDFYSSFDVFDFAVVLAGKKKNGEDYVPVFLVNRIKRRATN